MVINILLFDIFNIFIIFTFMEFTRMEWCCKIKLYIDKFACIITSVDHLGILLNIDISRYSNNFRYKFGLKPKKYIDRIKLLKLA
ncbi:hypothetical protein ACFL4T_13270, partial [candidate division KSB1 bacterium]